MEKTNIWFFTDNQAGEKIASSVKKLGLAVQVLKKIDFKKINLIEEEINFFIFHLKDVSPQEVLKKIKANNKINKFFKFFFLSKKDIKNLGSLPYNLLHLELISSKIDLGDFLLFLEKAVTLERYREIVKFISKEAESRLNIYESLISIHRKNIFINKKEKKVFEKIRAYEKKGLQEQDKISKNLSKVSSKVKDLTFDLKKRIKTDEIAADLRKKNLQDTKTIIADALIDAQQTILNLSAREVKSAEFLKITAEKKLKETKKELRKVKQELKEKK